MALLDVDQCKQVNDTLGHDAGDRLLCLTAATIKDHVRKGEVHLIKELMAKSTELGMQTLDQSLVKAYKEGVIAKEEALRFADSANDVRLQSKLHERDELGSGEGLGLTIGEEEEEGRFHGR